MALHCLLGFPLTLLRVKRLRISTGPLPCDLALGIAGRQGGPGSPPTMQDTVRVLSRDNQGRHAVFKFLTLTGAVCSTIGRCWFIAVTNLQTVSC